MPRANLLNTSSQSLLELMGAGKIYRVPPYQRDYSWQEEQWEDLWSDVVELAKDGSARHYMGALVVEAASDREFLIIDGQQRLATLSLLALAVIDRLKKLASQDNEAERNLERAAQLRSRFIGDKDPSSLLESSKLFLNLTDDGFYQDNLVQLRVPQNPRSLPASNKLLWDCFVFFQKMLEQSQFSNSGQNLSALLNEIVARQILFILITVDDDVNAYMVFETLNARGLELSATDLLKNYLFSKIVAEGDLASLTRRWHKLVTTVRQKKFPEFLRFHLLCDEPKIRQQRLFKLVRDRVQSPQNVFDLLEEIEGRAELFAALSDPDHDYWKERNGAKEHIQALKLFGVKQHTPAIFAAWEKFSSVEFIRLLKLIENFAFRYTVISRLNPNDLESAYHYVAKGILTGQFQTATAAIGPLRGLAPSDDKFERDFADATIRTSGAKQQLARYVLIKIESYVTGQYRDWVADPATIEHVLPENPGHEWENSIPPERQPDLIYRLGNLTLLERRKNRDAGNRQFSEKRGIYATSAYHLAASIDAFTGEDWSQATIDARQGRLAKKAVDVWRFA